MSVINQDELFLTISSALMEAKVCTNNSSISGVFSRRETNFWMLGYLDKAPDSETVEE